MNSTQTYKKAALYTLSAALLAVSQGSLAHTRLQTPVIDENPARHGRNYNNAVIGHGCRNADTGTADIDTIGTSLVFPDGVDSTITVDGEVTQQPLTDFVENWGSPVSAIQSNDIYKFLEHTKDPLGNKVGLWAGGPPYRQGDKTGLLPLRTSGVVFNPASCAKSVKFIVAIADICKITTVENFNDADVMLWTPAVGSDFDGGEDLNGYNSPASLTVMRSITELAPACGEGQEVVVTHSAAQLNRDMPIRYNGNQIWPAN